MVAPASDLYRVQTKNSKDSYRQGYCLLFPMGTLCCPVCNRVFTRAYNLQRHCKRATPCYEGEISGIALNSNRASGSNQCQTLAESLKQRKKAHYQRYIFIYALFLQSYGLIDDFRNAESLRITAKNRARQRRGVRQGSDTSKMVKLSQNKQAELLWRRMIRAVHWRNVYEKQIQALASQMAQLWSPGSTGVPPWVHIMYSAMKM